MGNVKGYVKTKEMVRLERVFPEQRYLSGFIHDASDSLVVMQEEYDFLLDGYSLLRLQDITCVEHSQALKFMRKILKKEGVIREVAYPEEIPLENIESSLAYFAMKKQIVIVECEVVDPGSESTFNIGIVSRIQDGQAVMWNFDALAKWYRRETFVGLDQITRVQFDTRYINMFAKYLPERKGKEKD